MTTPTSLESHPTPLLQERINWLNLEIRHSKGREQEHLKRELLQARKIMKARAKK